MIISAEFDGKQSHEVGPCWPPVTEKVMGKPYRGSRRLFSVVFFSGTFIANINQIYGSAICTVEPAKNTQLNMIYTNGTE